MEVNFYNILILTFCFVAIAAASYALLFSRRMHASFKFLAFFMIAVALENLQIWFLYTNLNKAYPVVELFFWPFEMLAIPLFFLFVITYLGMEKSYRVFRAFMFLPFIFFFVSYIWIKIDVIWFDGDVLRFARHELRLFRFEEYLAFLYAIFNGFYCYKVIQDFEKENAKYSYEKVTAQTVWLKRILYVSFFLSFLWAFTFAFVVFSKYSFGRTPYIPSYIGFSLLVIWLGYIGYYQSRVLYERLALQNFAYGNGRSLANGENDVTTINIEKESSTEVYFQQLQELFQKEKTYLNPSLDLRMVSERLNISANYLSKIVNKHGETNFPDFINNYRIKTAKKMLISQEFNQYTVLAIALEAGFNSRTTFYNSFKKQTGKSPAQYRQENS